MQGKNGDILKKQGFLKSSVILIISVIIVKIIGAMFKIPLTNMLGGTGMGYFSSAYGLFMPVYAFFVTGMSTAGAKQVAEYSALGKFNSIKKFKKLMLLCYGIIGIIGTMIIIFASKPFSYHVIQNKNAYLSVLATAPSIFFGCIMSAYRGYYEGLRNMYPTAVSQVTEGLTKLILGLFLCIYILENYDSIGIYLHGADRLSSASAGAVLGITLSALSGALFLFLRDIVKGDGITVREISQDKSKFSQKTALKSLFSVLIPVSLGSLVTNLTSLIDLGTIIRCINNAVEKSPQYFAENFSAFSATGADGFANFAYGSFIGLSVTIFNLVPSVTNMFGKGVLPSVTEAWTSKDKNALKKHTEDVLKITAFAAIPSGLGITVLAKPILELLYPSGTDEIQLAYESLSCLGIGVIFLALSFPVFSMLQGTGRADIPLKIMLAGVAVKFIGNILLVSVPQINITGAGISTDLCYLVILIISLYKLCRHTDIKINFVKLFFPSFYSGLLCAITAVLAYDIIGSAVIAILCGGVVYMIAVYLSDNAFFKSLISRTNKA
jgi:stage V sporulation protein B